ncbi:MAG: RtcB family protein [Oscillospiraceae bacterium]|nr:RtcB family protein [Oscillospiraceae bacterium]
MIEVRGAFNTAVCYTSSLDPAAETQIRTLCDQEAFAASRIRIMPDVHAGSGCTIGTTMTIRDKLVPGMVGVDIGCGMETVKLEEKELDFSALDSRIRRAIPSGAEVRRERHPFSDQIDLNRLRCAKHVDLERARRSIGTLGGGNHFIEVDRGEHGDLYLVIHSGSRYLGKQVCEYYQEQGYRALSGGSRSRIEEMIREMKRQGRAREIQAKLEELRQEEEDPPLSRELAYVEGALFEDYIHDMRIVQRFAMLNRNAMSDVILTGLGLTRAGGFTTVHNYIDTDNMILRKGAVSAKAGETLLIPINMRDGSLLCIGRGNEEWNCSAPHGAGRLMSRRAAHETLSLETYREQMRGVYSTCVTESTLDEAPMAYKSLEEIVSQIGPTAEILERIRPLYNYKETE